MRGDEVREDRQEILDLLGAGEAVAPSVERVRTKKFEPFCSISTDSILTGDLIRPGRLNIGCSASRTRAETSAGAEKSAARRERGREAASAAPPVSLSQSRRVRFMG
jgi:hypothetical protein